VNPTALTIIGLRAAALALALTGNQKAANSLYLLADAAEAGLNIDAHMKAVGEKLKSRTVNDADWEDVNARIDADFAHLQSL
jgi:hypothetical protein